MTTLDEKQTYNINPASVSPWPTAIRYGVIGGLIFCVYTLVGNLTGMTTGKLGATVSILSSLLVVAIGIGIIVVSVKHHRDKELGGYITLGRVVLVGTVVVFLTVLISNIFNYIYMNFIDPNYVMDTLVAFEEMMSDWIPEDQMDETLAGMKESMEPAKMFTTGLLFPTLLGAFVSAIIGLIMKVEPPRV